MRGFGSSVHLHFCDLQSAIVGLVETECAGFYWDGLLGSGFFSKFTSSFDYPNRRVYLVPNHKAAARSIFDASGVGFERGNDGYVVDIVSPDTPASAASLQEVDVLISIDGVPAGDLDPVELRQRLNRSGKKCRHDTVTRNTSRFCTLLTDFDRSK